MPYAQTAKYSARTTGSSIYLNLRDDILSLRLKPNTEIMLNDLAAEMKVSRSPVRDALMRLNADGLVDIFPQRGTRISPISLKRVEEERFLRRSIEEHLLRHFIALRQETDILEMRECVARQHLAIRSNDPHMLLNMDDSFHRVIFRAVDKMLCWDLVQTQCTHYRRIRLMTLLECGVMPNVVEQHEALLIACEERDLAAALAIEQTHLNKLDDEKIQLANAHPDYFTL